MCIQRCARGGGGVLRGGAERLQRLKVMGLGYDLEQQAGVAFVPKDLCRAHKTEPMNNVVIERSGGAAAYWYCMMLLMVSRTSSKYRWLLPDAHKILRRENTENNCNK